MARRRQDPTSAREVLDHLEQAIETLRVAYEKYFAGVDKAAPVRMRDKVERQVRLLDRMQVRSTAIRFKMGGLRARFVTYKHYWTRVEHQLERGISRRDLLRIRSGLGAPKPAEPNAAAEAAEAAESATPEAAAAGVPPPPPTSNARRQGPPAAPGGNGRVDPRDAGLDPGHLRQVFKQLVKAKRAAGESTDGLTYAALCRKLAREAPKLREKHKCDEVRFEVQTVGGRVRLRARTD